MESIAEAIAGLSEPEQAQLNAVHYLASGRPSLHPYPPGEFWNQIRHMLLEHSQNSCPDGLNQAR
jgi:hypothetical protein